MDLDGLIEVLKRIEQGEIRCVAIDTREPSPFSHEILNSNPYTYLDNAPLEERRARAVQTRRALPEEAEELGQLDPEAIQQVRQESWPPLARRRRNPRCPAQHGSDPSRPSSKTSEAELQALEMEHRAVRVSAGRTEVLGGGGASRAGASGFSRRRSHPGDPIRLNARRMPGTGIATRTPKERSPKSSAIASTRPVRRLPRSWPKLYGASPGAIDTALHRIEAEGQILRGSFRPAAAELEWCNRRLLARIHRLTLGRLRREIEPASPAQFMRFLLQVAACRTRHAPVRGIRCCCRP